MMRILHILILINILVFLGFCSKPENTVLESVQLVENPGGTKPEYVPNGKLNRGEYVILVETKEFQGKSWDKVQIVGTSTTGWMASSVSHKGKLPTVTVTKDSVLFSRPNPKSPEAGKARAGQVAFQLEADKENKFVLIQFPGTQGFISEDAVGAPGEVIRTVNIPGLGQARVRSSSQWKSEEGKESSFDPRNLFDRSLQTGWCEGADGEGVGESITLEFGNWVTVDKIEVVNGWAESEDAYNRNNRVSKLRVTADRGNESFELQDGVFDYQFICCSGGMGGSTFTFTIDGAYSGRMNDTCFSEIRLSGFQGGAPAEGMDSHDH